MKYIIVAGTPITGFSYTGPFDKSAKATEYGENYIDVEWWVVALNPLNSGDPDIDIEFDEPETIRSLNNLCICGHLWTQHIPNVYGAYICSQCSCRGMNPPSENP